MAKINQAQVEAVKVATGRNDEVVIKRLLQKHNGSVLLTIREMVDSKFRENTPSV